VKKTPWSDVPHLIAGLAVFCSLTACSQTTDWKALESDLQQMMTGLAVENIFPGATLAVVLPDGDILHLAAGTADLETGAAMPDDARMFSGSIGKTFVAAVALELVAEGKLALDAPLASYLGEAPWFTRLPNHGEITIRMILNHTGGLPRYVLEESFWNELNADPDRVWKPEELIAIVLDAPALHPPGEGWGYSDTDYILLGMVIEKLCGRTYYEELTERVLHPLRLSDTTPSVSRIIPRLVPGYTGGERAPFFLPERVLVDGRYVLNPQFEWTGGGLVTSSRDLAVFAKELFEGRVLSSEMTAMMIAGAPVNIPESDWIEYGLGVQIWTSPFGTIYGHGGIFPGYQSQMEFLPALKCSMALQANADATGARLKRPLHSIASDVWQILHDHLQE